MKSINTIQKLVEACSGKFLVMHSMKTPTCEMDARKKGCDMKRLLVFKIVGQDSSTCTIFYPGSARLNCAKFLATGKNGDSTYDTALVFELFQFNLKRGNRIEIVERLLEQEKKDLIYSNLETMTESEKMAKTILKASACSEKYRGKEGKVPTSLVFHNHGFPNQRISYKLNGTRVYYQHQYEQARDIEIDQSRFDLFSPYSFLTYSQYYGSYNKDWSVYKPSVKDLKRVNELLERAVESSKMACKLAKEWLDLQNCNPL